MKIKEAIILAGGLGTRLRSVVSELPKCMAPVAGRPFLFYVINYLRSEGIEKFIFSLGYKHESIEGYLRDQFATLDYQIAIEREPLGTGGAARLACHTATEKNILLANGDTLFRVSLDDLSTFHAEKKAACTLSLKSMKNFDRYGVVETGRDGSIKSFREKRYYPEGLINGGVYALNVEKFLVPDFPEKFSFETEFLEKTLATGPDGEAAKTNQQLFGLVQDSYFIDIGIPEDFKKAQEDFQQAPLDLKAINNEWTLFLDRDGVINKEKPGSYVFNPAEFIFYPGAKESFRFFAETFGRIIVITNQRGIGKGLMTEKDLELIHQKLLTEVKNAGASIDAIYFCSAANPKDPCRKPNPGMAVRAKGDFPGIDFNRSVMVGNKGSDMRFGKNAGLYTVFLKTTHPEQGLPHPDIDLVFDSLIDFAKAL